jgi:hypothetical protein
MATAKEALDSFSEMMDAYREFLQLAYDALAPDATRAQREAIREQIKLFIDDRPTGQSQNQPAQE